MTMAAVLPSIWDSRLFKSTCHPWLGWKKEKENEIALKKNFEKVVSVLEAIYFLSNENALLKTIERFQKIDTFKREATFLQFFSYSVN